MKFFLFLIALCGLTYFFLEAFNKTAEAPEKEVINAVEKKIKKEQPKVPKVHKEKKSPIRKKRQKPLIKLKKVSVTQKTIRSVIDWEKTDTLETIGDGHLIKIELIDGQEVVHGDILIPKSAKRIGAKVLLRKPRLWEYGIIPYTVDKKLPNYAAVTAAIAYINKETNINFVKRQGEKDYVAIISGKSNCYSGVGRHGGKQLITLSALCNRGAIIHELVHTIGFFHEQSRSDRDEYLDIFWGNIEIKYWPQFKKIQKVSTHTPDSPFDLKSIMLYPPNAFAINKSFATMGTVDGELYTPASEELSYWDKEEINALYPLP